MELFLIFLGMIVLVFILSFFLSSMIENKSGTEIMLLSILFVLAGLSFFYFDANFISNLKSIGFGLVLFGLVIGVASFIFKRN